MFKRATRGEISTLLVLGTLVVVGVATLLSSTVGQQRNITNTRAATPDGLGGFCEPFYGGADSRGCGGTEGCNTWEKCNFGDGTSNTYSCVWDAHQAWATMPDSRRCGSSGGSQPTATQAPIWTPTGGVTIPTATPGSGSQQGPCNKSEGCGGGPPSSCNLSINNGCGFGGCRAWERCQSNGGCLDTTAGGTSPAAADACHSRAQPGQPQPTVVLPTVTPTTRPGTTATRAPTATPSRAPILSPMPTATPTAKPGSFCGEPGRNCCSGLTPCNVSGYTCISNTCQIATPTPTKSSSDRVREGTSTPTPIDSERARQSPTPTPTPTVYNVFLPIIGDGATPTPTTSVRIPERRAGSVMVISTSTIETTETVTGKECPTDIRDLPAGELSCIQRP